MSKSHGDSLRLNVGNQRYKVVWQYGTQSNAVSAIPEVQVVQMSRLDSTFSYDYYDYR